MNVKVKQKIPLKIKRMGIIGEGIGFYKKTLVFVPGALKGEDVILELARKFLEGLTDKQLNELVYDKVETDMIWIRLNGSIVGGIIGFFAFWLLQLVNN